MADVSTVDRNGVQVVRRAAAILRALRDDGSGLTLSEIADRVGLARSTVHRLIAALEEERFVVAASSSRGFLLGSGLATLTVAATRDLIALLHPFLASLSVHLSETVDLAVLEQDSVSIVDRVVAASQTLVVQSHAGALLPAHSTAPGKALLAELSNEEIEALLPPRLARLTPATVTSRAKLLEELDLVRETGIAYVAEETAAGICAISIAVGGSDRAIAAISVLVPITRFDESQRAIVPALRRAAEEIGEFFHPAEP